MPRTNPLGAFDIDWNARPETVVADITARATRLETPCGDGTMVWHRWDGPIDGPTDKPPTVLLHGGWGSWTHWIKTVPLLATERTVYAADMPGMGDAADAPEPHGAEGISTIVADGINEILPDGTPYHAVGFSFGGVMGTWAAARHGKRCVGLTLVGAAGFLDLHFIVEGIRVPELTLPDADIDAIHTENLKRLMLVDHNLIDPLALHTHRQNIARGRVRTRRISLSNALVEALPRVVSPMGGIWGALDATGGGVADIEKRRDILRELDPDAPFDIVEGAGHWIMYEAPELFVETLSRHLAFQESRAR
ncbi:MAG: alpha/beta hydrolase [Rhodospirillaceae bacterium]|jgi:pimeloyl-ACP methyl ester carboxylesterase|nr:alpha/beta hydrolase [Rhodospirillaceae bacterium]MBT5512459.1 alpha/beta hydrolase [Rhodospirillaceae bacterium]MBT6886058.1 alpha/beta hydrolase [Rhodospirillaceae bacterium]MBT7510553.1 alpha/beta hydrolase [Rhodospirillaceae bacterium]